MTQLDLIDETAVRSDEPANRLGRKRDHTRDADILDAALEILAEEGYDGMTVDMVAARAKAGKATLYRRWPSKAELVMDAVACMKNGSVDLDNLPDTGTLRGDLISVIKAPSIKDGERKLRVMAGLVSLLARNPELAETANAAIVEPRASINRVFFKRAIERGEIAPDTDVELLSHIGASMSTYRVLILQKPVTREFLIGLIDHVVLPAVGLGRSARQED
jgi:AcrR family transcriptional regulator